MTFPITRSKKHFFLDFETPFRVLDILLFSIVLNIALEIV